MVQNTPKIHPISDQNGAKSTPNVTLRTSGGPWGAPVPPRYLKKSTFWTLSGSCGVPLSAPWGHLGPLGGHSGDVCVSTNRVFLPCDVQAHFLHHFGMLFRAFWEHFGSVLGGVGVPNRLRSGKVVIYANLGISYVKLRFAWVRAMGNVTPQGPKSV